MTKAHQLPRIREVFKSQLILIIRLRRKALYIGLSLVLLQVVVLALFGVVLGVTISTGDEVTTTGMAHISKFQEMGYPFDEGASAVAFGFAFLTIFGLFWPFNLWHDESPSRRGYHWSMPVDQRRHDLLRFASGGVYLALVGTVIYLTAIILALATGHAAGLAEFSAWAWVGFLVAPWIPYTFASIFAIRSDHATGWFWCTVGLVSLLCTFSVAVDWLVATSLFKFLGTHRLGPIAALLGLPIGDIFGIADQTGPGWAATWALWLLFFSGIVVWVSGHRPRSTCSHHLR